MITTIATVGTVLTMLGTYIENELFKLPPLPVLDENAWWGPGSPAKVDSSIRPFQVNVSDEVLTDLKLRLDNARPLTPPLEGIAQQYGLNTKVVQRFVDYWKTSYKWKERQQYFNKFPQFKTNIQGLDIHFLHVKPTNTQNKKVLPILLVHGWPGSPLEFYKLIPLLTTPDNKTDFVFEVVAPYIPGFGFSQASSKPGLGPAQIGVIFKQLMKRLGHAKFYAQAGDFGAIIVQYMTVLFPDIFLGYHSNYCLAETAVAYGKYLLGTLDESIYFGKNKPANISLYPLMKTFEKKVLSTGYLHLQATRPDRLGTALNDSPVGLLAYILDGFSGGTRAAFALREDAGLPGPYTYDELLDNIMLYWITGTATTSMRLYAEGLSKATQNLNVQRHPVTVPSACIRFSNEITYAGDGVIYDAFPNLVHKSDYEGGHFAAFENPEILAKDVKIAVQKFLKVNKSQ